MSARKAAASARRWTRSSSAAGGRRKTGTPETVTWAYGVLAGRVTMAVLARLPRLPHAGAPYTIALSENLSIVVAPVPREPFEAGALEAHLLDIEWVGRYAAAHHAVLARLAQRATVLPLRIFTVFDSDDRAKRALGRNRRRLASLAQRVGARAEWVLRVHRPAAAPKSAPRNGRVSGTAFLQTRARAERDRVASARRIDAGVTALLHDLTGHADDAAERAVEPGTSAVAEAAFLIRDDNIGSFKRALARSSAELRHEGCRIALTGPWPVYSFVDMPGAGHPRRK